MEKWKYQTFTIPQLTEKSAYGPYTITEKSLKQVDSILNGWGEQGWELVNQVPLYGGDASQPIMVYHLLVTLKRKIT